MDTDLRVGLWNAVDGTYWIPIDPRTYPVYQQGLHQFFQSLWHAYFHRPFDTLPYSLSETLEQIRDHFFKCDWWAVYDFLEAMVRLYPYNNINDDFQRVCNIVLAINLSGYRFVDGQVTPITTEEELAAVEKALQIDGKLKPVILHLKQAISLLSDRKSPDYRNSINESISAIESICKLMTGMAGATLGPAIKALEPKLSMHKDLKEAFHKLSGTGIQQRGVLAAK
jgi:hypothetical protein